MPVTLAMSELTCWDCGIQYAAPYKWAKAKCGDGGKIMCPNGHPNGYAFADDHDDKLEDLQEENEDLRRQIMQLTHDHEQAEARLRDERPLKDPADLPAVPQPAGEVEPTGEVTALRPRAATACSARAATAPTRRSARCSRT